MDQGVINILVVARSRINRGWVRGHEAVNASGRSVSPLSQEAVAWCLAGSMTHFNTDDDIQCSCTEAARIVSRIIDSDLDDSVRYQSSVYMIIADFNDDIRRKKEDIISVLDKAIEQESMVTE